MTHLYIIHPYLFTKTILHVPRVINKMVKSVRLMITDILLLSWIGLESTQLQAGCLAN